MDDGLEDVFFFFHHSSVDVLFSFLFFFSKFESSLFRIVFKPRQNVQNFFEKSILAFMVSFLLLFRKCG